MKITPLDIYQQEFKKVLRGFDPTEVSGFLETVADDYEQLIKENSELKDKLKSMESQLSLDESPEDTGDIQTFVTKEEADNLILKAREEAEKIIMEARREAGDIISKAVDESREVKAQTEGTLKQPVSSEEAEGLILKAKGEAQDLILEARKEAEDIINKAKGEVGEIRARAEKAARESVLQEQEALLGEKKAKIKELDEIIEQAKTEELHLRREVSSLQGQKERFLIEYRELLEKYLRMVIEDSGTAGEQA